MPTRWIQLDALRRLTIEAKAIRGEMCVVARVYSTSPGIDDPTADDYCATGAGVAVALRDLSEFTALLEDAASEAGW